MTKTPIEHKIKLMRFWLKRDLKPFVRIEPKIKRNGVDEYKAKETNKVFNDGILNHAKGDLTFKEILDLNLSNDDLKDFIKIHCPEVVSKLQRA